MTTIEIQNGHDLPLAGRPEVLLDDAPRPGLVALKPEDFRYIRPRLKVTEGQAVKTGTTLFENKDDPRLCFVSPGAGRIAEIRYGERRRLLEIIVELGGEEDFEEAGELQPDGVRALSREDLVTRLLTSGLWPLIRQRPFSRIADPDGRPKAVFIGAMAADPFDPDPELLIGDAWEDFQLGIDALAKLTEGKVYLGTSPTVKNRVLLDARNVEKRQFTGLYPAGKPEVQIYYVCPPRDSETVWYVGVQELLTIARSLKAGHFVPDRIVSLGGSGAKSRRSYRTLYGAAVECLLRGNKEPGEHRIISGGVLTETKVTSKGFLGFYDQSLCLLPEGHEREMLGFMRPGMEKYSLSRAFLSTLFGPKEYTLNTNKQGSLRNFVLNGIYEEVCPVDILPQQLAKAVLAGDIEDAEKHGILDCVECGLCSFVCPSKIEVAGIIRSGIDDIFKEGLKG